jgi:hypothetical protein
MGIPSISIVIAYYNRRRLLEATLQSINKTDFPGDIEICICDDASSYEQKLSKSYIKSLVKPGINVKLDIVKAGEKNWVNSCVPYNRALKLASGEIIIIQNPECWHFGDILSYTSENLSPKQWISFACFALDEECTETILETEKKPERFVGVWYNHKVYRHAGYHFCAAIYKEDIDRVGGFDEIYKNGVGYEDDDLIHRLFREEIEISCLDEKLPIVCHLYHKSVFCNMDLSELKNRRIFENRSNQRNVWYFNKIPKIAHFYWGYADNILPFLNYLTLYSFRKMNPDWEIILYLPKEVSKLSTLSNNTVQENQNKITKSYLDKVEEQNVKIEIFDFESIGIDNNIPENFKSDFLAWHILSTKGGLYSDMDILYFDSMNSIIHNRAYNYNKDTFLCYYGFHTVGFLLSSNGNEFFKYILSKAIVTYDVTLYQSAGSMVLDKYCSDFNKLASQFHIDAFNMRPYTVCFFNSYQLDDLYINNKADNISVSSIGLHWYGSAGCVQKEYDDFLYSIDETNYMKFNNTISKIIERILY